jgi:peroxiredoxin
MRPSARPASRWWGALLAILLLAALPARAGEAAVGRTAHDLALPGLADPISLAQFRGQVVLLDFWASWCGPCAQSFPWLESLHLRLRDRGFTVLGVNVDKQRKKADAFLSGRPVSFPVAFDPQGGAAAAYTLPGMPTSYLIDRRGVLRRIHTGFRPGEIAELEAFIQCLLAEPAPPATSEGDMP